MSVIGSNILAGASGQAGYNLTKSLRFRASAGAWLNRTFGTPTLSTKWTWSGWFKLGSLTGTNKVIFDGGSPDTRLVLQDISNGPEQLIVGNDTTTFLATSAVYRDYSAWYHAVLAFDSSQGTASNRLRLYINGSEVTAFATDNRSSISGAIGINTATAHGIGKQPAGGVAYFDGYMAEVNFIDGQQLTPSSFGETSTTTGVWIPKKYTGTYGTNGFYLPFTDTTSTSTLGTDFSGNSNTWTVNNISLTSGSTYDSMNDVPTLTSATTANYCVLNPLDKGSSANPSIQAGNLNIVGSDSSSDGVRSTIAITSGKWYWEAKIVAISGQTRTGGGIYKATDNLAGDYGNGTLVVFDYLGTIYISDETGGSSSVYYSTGGSISAGDVFGFAFDADTGKVYISQNGTYFNSGVPASGTGNVATLTTGISYFAGGWAFNSSDTTSFTFGQQPFSYTPPTGFVRLNTFNLPTPTIGATASTTANKYMNIALWTANETARTIDVGFEPGLVWAKSRSTAWDHTLFDSVRGSGKSIKSNTTGAEATSSTSLTGFVSNGFTLGVNSDGPAINYATGQTFVGWAWQASGSGSSNTAGSITSTVSANTTAGFSIVTWTGNGANANIGHGLGVVPSMIITKFRSSTSNWSVYTTTTGAGSRLKLNLTDATAADGSFPTTPTSSIFYVNAGGNDNGVTQVAYCFAQVAGYSAFGSYTGNGSTDGPFIYLGFRPRFVMFKSTGIENWIIHDTARDPYNVSGLTLIPNLSDSEYSNNQNMDILSNGVKMRSTNDPTNTNGVTYTYACFAENPFKYANAR